MLAVFRLPAAAAWPLLPPEEPPEAEVPDELHPTTSAAAAAAAGSASSIHGRRLRAFSVSRDLIITFSFACRARPAIPAPGRRGRALRDTHHAMPAVSSHQPEPPVQPPPSPNC